MVRRTKRIEVFRDRAGKYRYREVAANGEPINQSQAYATRSNARRAARANVPGAPVISVDRG